MLEKIDPHLHAAEVRELVRKDAFAREAVWTRTWMEKNEPDLVIFLDLAVQAFNARLRRYWCPINRQPKRGGE